VQIRSSLPAWWAVRAAVAAVLGSVLAMPSLVAAQEAGDEEVELEEIQVTGSRIQRPDYVSSNPVQSIGADDMDKLGIVSVAEAVAQIPSNVSSFQPAATGAGSFFVGSTLANLRGLNPYFGTRTLTLVNSRRFVPSNQGGSVDLGLIPSTLIQRMEVVTGGASAAYGSDAVSGVVNVILDQKLQGVKFESDYGLTEAGDGTNYHFGLGAGTAFAGGRGHVVFGADYQKNNAINDCAAARDWCAESWGVLSNGGSGFENHGDSWVTPTVTPLVPGAPQNMIVSGLRVNQANKYGVVYNPNAGAATAVSGNAAGSGLGTPFQIGQYGTVSVTRQSAIGGDGELLTKGTTLYPDIDRKTAYTYATFDFTDGLQGYFEGSFGQSKAQSWQEVATGSQYCLHADNAYLQGTAIGAAAAAYQGNGGTDACLTPFYTQSTDVVVRKDWNDQRDGYVATDTKTIRGVLGLTGHYADTWTWDAYYQFGRTERSQIVNDSLSSKRMTMAVDAVLDGSGNAVCRVNAVGVGAWLAGQGIYSGPGDPTYDAYAALAPSCQPVNVFGTQDQAGFDYVFGNLTETNVIKQHVLAASTSGELWQGWGAGPLMAAAGGEYRIEKLTNDAGDLPFYERTDFAAQFGDSFAGKTTVAEAFVELEMPLLRDLPGANLLTLNGAARHTRYKTEDDLNTSNPDSKVDVTTWKLSSVWEPLDWLRIRGSYSRDMRAAGFRELYYSQTMPADPPFSFFGFGGFSSPWVSGAFGGPEYDEATVLFQGNTELKPEKASTGTIGFVLMPKGAAQGLMFSADYYHIKLDGAIRGGNVAEVITYCSQGNMEYCALIDGAQGGTPIAPGLPSYSDVFTVRVPYRNGRLYVNSGVDLSANYLLPLANLFESVPGSIAFGLSATRAIKSEVQRYFYTATPDPDAPDGYKGVNLVGQSGGNSFLADFSSTPKWTGNFTTSYFNGPLSVTAQLRYVGKGKVNIEDPYLDPSDAGYDWTLTDTITSNKVPSALYVGLTTQYDFRFQGLQKAQLYLTVNNLFDKDPPFAAGSVGGTNAMFFDTLGRSFRVGARLQF
jgi:outer membrane receptor protein involved in Fe transport